jgi:DNA-binding protein Fis
VVAWWENDVRALLRSDRADDELAKALAKAGLYVERLDGRVEVAELEAKLACPDLAVVDPRLLDGQSLPPPYQEGGAQPSLSQRAGDAASFEAMCTERLAAILDRLGDETLPNLHETVVGQVERALFRLVLEREGSVGAVADFLGIHRNTLSRKLQQLGLRETPRRRA